MHSPKKHPDSMNSPTRKRNNFINSPNSRSNDIKERHLSFDEVQFFERAMDTYNSLKDDPMALNDFFTSIDQNLRGKEILVAQHKTCSRFMESYIQECPIESLHRLFKVFSGHFQELAVDKFASHAVEMIIEQTIKNIGSNVGNPTFPELVSSLVTELTLCSAELAEDPSGSHVVRSILTNLSNNRSIAPKIDKFCRKIIQAFLDNPQGKIRSTHFSACMQSISSLPNQHYQKLLNYLNSSVPCDINSVCNPSGSKLIEAMIKASPSFSATLYDKVLKTQSIDVALDKYGNYVIQRWLESSDVDEQLFQVLSQLTNEFDTLAFQRIPSVLISAATACVHCPRAQKPFLIACQSFADKNISEENDRSKSDNHTKSDNSQETNSRKENSKGKKANFIASLLQLNYKGSGGKILQAICGFSIENQQPLIDAIMDLSIEEVSKIAMDRDGSFFIRDFLQSEVIEMKARMKLIRRLLPRFKDLAIDENASYVVTAAFNSADMKTKVLIAENLANEDVETGAKEIWKRLKLNQFLQRRAAWEKEIQIAMKRKAALNELIAIEPNNSILNDNTERNTEIIPEISQALNDANINQDSNVLNSNSLEDSEMKPKKHKKHHRSHENIINEEQNIDDIETPPSPPPLSK